jgi:quinol monooxygenase YgiN
MITRIAQFRVRREAVADCLEAIREFVMAVRSEPGTLLYESFRLPDGVTFQHAMRFRDEEAEEQHQRTEHQRRFAQALESSCEAPPSFTMVQTIASATAKR